LSHQGLLSAAGDPGARVGAGLVDFAIFRGDSVRDGLLLYGVHFRRGHPDVIPLALADHALCGRRGMMDVGAQCSNIATSAMRSLVLQIWMYVTADHLPVTFHSARWRWLIA